MKLRKMLNHIDLLVDYDELAEVLEIKIRAKDIGVGDFEDREVKWGIAELLRRAAREIEYEEAAGLAAE